MTQTPEQIARRKLELWFFRDMDSDTRRKLFALFELPLDEIRNQHVERICFDMVLNGLQAQENTNAD